VIIWVQNEAVNERKKAVGLKFKDQGLSGLGLLNEDQCVLDFFAPLAGARVLVGFLAVLLAAREV